MEKMIKKTAKKAAVMIIALVMAIAFMPALAFEAHAGGGYDMPPLNGVKGDGTVDPQMTLSMSADDLEAAQSGFKEAYAAGLVTVSWGISKDSSFTDSTYVKGTYSGGVFSLNVPISYAGKWITFYVSGEDAYGTNFNNNTAPVKVYDTVNVVDGPIFATDLPSISAKNPLKMNFTFQTSGSFIYYWSDQYRTFTLNKKILRLYKNGKKIAEKAASGNTITFKNVAVSYNKYDKFKAQLCARIGGAVIEGPVKSFRARSVKVGKNKVYATKISSNRAIVRWTGASYANKYRIYKGSKLIKTVGKSKRKYVVKKRGAGKAKYRVVPIYKSGSKVCKGTSSKVKPKKNQVRYNRSTYYGSATYATCPFVVTKISLKGRTYTVTGYALNNRIFNMSKYSRLTLKLRVEGKKAFSKTFRNLHVGAKDESSKKIVLKIKGRAGADLANGGTSLSISEKPYWTWAGRHIK